MNHDERGVQGDGERSQVDAGDSHPGDLGALSAALETEALRELEDFTETLPAWKEASQSVKDAATVFFKVGFFRGTVSFGKAMLNQKEKVAHE